jgi:hypothetical protein
MATRSRKRSYKDSSDFVYDTEDQYTFTVVYDVDGVRERIKDISKLTDKAGNQLDARDIKVNNKVMCLYSPDGRPYSCRVTAINTKGMRLHHL